MCESQPEGTAHSTEDGAGDTDSLVNTNSKGIEAGVEETWEQAELCKSRE